MIKIHRILLVSIILVSLVCSVIMYSDNAFASTYTRQIAVTITDTTHTSRSNIPCVLNSLSAGLNLSYLQTAGFILGTGLDTALQDNASTDIAYDLSLTRSPILIPSLGADQSTTYQFLLGYSPAKTAFSPIMVNGSGGYITTLDNAALELGNNFSIETQGYVDTSVGTNKFIVEKDGAFLIDAGSTTTGEITGTIIQTDTVQQNAQDSVYSIANGIYSRLGERINNFTGTICSLSFYLHKIGAPTGTGYARIYNATTGALISTLGSIDISTISGMGLTWYTFSSIGTTITATDIRICFQWDDTIADGNYVDFGYRDADVYASGVLTGYAGGWTDYAAKDATFKYGSPIIVNSVVATGSHTVKVYADATDLKMDIDGANVDSTALGGASVINNANNIISNVNGSMSYINYLKWTVGGVEKFKYQTPTGILSDTTLSYTTGTATFTLGSSTITGAGGASWTSAMIGGQIKDDTDGIYYTIADVTSATSITINGLYGYTGGGGHTYTIQYSTTATLFNVDSPGTYDGTITWGYNSGLKITFGVLTNSPSITTLSPVSISSSGATLQGTLNGLGSYTFGLCYFQYGLDTGYGTTSASSQVVAIGGFFAVITGLTYNTTYHVQAIGQFGSYTVYGADVTFTTMPFAGSSTTISIRQVGAFSNYYQSGDMLFCVETVNTYTNYFPNIPPGDYFVIQLIGTDHTTILGQTPLSNWGDRPTAIYFSAASVTAHSMAIGSLYYIKMIGSYIGGTPSVETQLVAYDWKGIDLTRLDAWIRGVAINMGQADSTTYLTPITDYGLVLNDTGGAYVTAGIPGISQVRPNLFTSSASEPQFTQGTANNAFDSAAVWNVQVGAQVAADATTFGNLFNVSGQTMAGWIFILIMLFITFIGIAQGGRALGVILLNIPILMAANYLRCISIQYTVIIAFIMAYLFIRQFYWKTT